MLTLTVGLLTGGYLIFLPAAAGRAQARPQAGDPVARLQQRLERGEVRLDYAAPGGWLQSVLKHLGVPVSSQGLVFSKTSLQSNHISPANPRAIYFNDEVYVGWIRGAELLEISAVDPDLGGIFYTLEQRPGAQPKFVRNESCMRCHGTGNTKFVPGHLMRSVYAGTDGFINPETNSFVTDHASPFSDRFGGWYVTGQRGPLQHLGNTFFSGEVSAGEFTGNLTSLAQTADLSGYASPHSDIVALMVLAHQTQMQNMLVWLGYETRMALHEQAEPGKATRRGAGELPVSNRRRIEYAADETLKYLLFADEAGLPSAVAGTSGFATEFASAGPFDKQGRSLRQFDLARRLFRYPCSYLIYSEAFDRIPQPALDYLYRRLWLVLTNQTQAKEFASLSAADRRAILEILLATKKNLPAYFRAQISSGS